MTHTNFQIDLDFVTPVEQLQFEHLDKRYRLAHIVGTVILYVILMALAVLLLLLDTPWICIATECALFVAMLVNVTFLPKAFYRKGYALREHDVTYRTGILFPKLSTIPFARVQQVSVNQNPVTKLFHLYSVEIVNGAQGFSAITIPGLSEENANRIKNLITEKLQSTHD